MNDDWIPFKVEDQNVQTKDFSYNEKQIRVIIDEDGNPWWIAKDVCEILEYSKDISSVVSKLDEDEKMIRKISVWGKISNGNEKTRDMWTINEFGLYSLMLSSNKPEAKSFKRWITHDVLPEIRKTGGYNSGSQLANKELIQALIPSIEKGFERIGERIEKSITNGLEVIASKIEDKVEEGFKEIAWQVPGQFSEAEKSIKELCSQCKNILEEKYE